MGQDDRPRLSGLSFEQHPAFRAWLCQKLGISSLLPNSTTIAVVNGNGITAVAAYSMFNGVDCWISIAGEGRWLTKSIVPVFFRYPFNQHDCRRISAFCKATNTHAIQFAERFGFKQEGRFRHYFEDGADCIPLGLLREDCKWV